MNVEIKPIGYHEKEILRRLLEFYLYELSIYTDQIEMNEHGIFGYRYLDHYWTEKDRYPFFIFGDAKLAGFMLVRKFDYSGNEDYKWLMSEFFVLKKYQKRGIGRSAAYQVFDSFFGPWIVAQIETNETSRHFWKRVISEYTAGNYIESKLGSQPAQEFISNNTSGIKL
ncbi:GNAT family N-acetyltransferase [Paenibacillus sp. FSL W8-0194]|uniref:GNAT family N-acetyltransferase n=1 Tax=Paenibacillus sp. FSL W8-0194 TaxID=2921711 RepID=UPI0030DB5C2A